MWWIRPSHKILNQNLNPLNQWLWSSSELMSEVEGFSRLIRWRRCRNRTLQSFRSKLRRSNLQLKLRNSLIRKFNQQLKAPPNSKQTRQKKLSTTSTNNPTSTKLMLLEMKHHLKSRESRPSEKWQLRLSYRMPIGRIRWVIRLLRRAPQ